MCQGKLQSSHIFLDWLVERWIDFSLCTYGCYLWTSFAELKCPTFHSWEHEMKTWHLLCVGFEHFPAMVFMKQVNRIFPCFSSSFPLRIFVLSTMHIVAHWSDFVYLLKKINSSHIVRCPDCNSCQMYTYQVVLSFLFLFWITSTESKWKNYWWQD